MASLATKIQHYAAIIAHFFEAQTDARKADEPRILYIEDKERHHYQLLFSGWLDEDHFSHDILIHIHIETDGKVWILANETETLIGKVLAEKGIPLSEIVIGYQPKKYRIYTEFAVN